jgi:ABC-type lipoprotein release transport system permease subunit
MSFLKKLADKLGINYDESVFSSPDRTEEISEERNNQKRMLIENLKRIHFSDSEIEEVTYILTKCEQMIQVVKDDLIGTNINNPDPQKILVEKLEKIREIELNGAKDIREKIAEIIERKKKK